MRKVVLIALLVVLIPVWLYAGTTAIELEKINKEINTEIEKDGEEFSKEIEKEIETYKKEKGKHSLSLKCLTSEAEKGDVRAECFLGLTYHDKEDYKKAVYWLEKAANHQESSKLTQYVQYMLGMMYLGRGGVLKNPKKTVYWFEKAANQGLAEAQYGLGTMYLTGKGVPKNPKKTVYWLKKAANQGLAEAQYSLGIMYLTMYLTGDGVPKKNLRKAAYWVKKAYKNGFEKAAEIWNEYELWKYEE